MELSAFQRHALAGMGVDVWVRRGIAKPSVAVAAVPRADRVSAPVERRPDPVSAPIPTTATAIARQVSETSVLRLVLECVAATGVVAIGQFDDPSDHRLAQDVALAIAGANAQTQHAQFRWPQTQTGDSTLAAARNAYRAFLRGQIERAGARMVLLFGAATESLLDSDSMLSEIEVFRFSDLHALRADPLAKKRLWLSVSPHVRA